MKLSLTIIAIGFAMTNAPAFAQEWDVPSEAPAVQFTQPTFIPQTTPVFNPSGTQWDLSAVEPTAVEHDPVYVANSTAKTGSQAPSGLPECRTAILGPISGPTNENGLPQCSLAIISTQD